MCFCYHLLYFGWLCIHLVFSMGVVFLKKDSSGIPCVCLTIHPPVFTASPSCVPRAYYFSPLLPYYPYLPLCPYLVIVLPALPCRCALTWILLLIPLPVLPLHVNCSYMVIGSSTCMALICCLTLLGDCSYCPYIVSPYRSFPHMPFPFHTSPLNHLPHTSHKQIHSHSLPSLSPFTMPSPQPSVPPISKSFSLSYTILSSSPFLSLSPHRRADILLDARR